MKTQIEPAMFSAVSATSRALRLGVVLQQGQGRGLGEAAAGAHGDQAVFGFDHVAVAGDDQRGILVGDREHGFEAAQGAVGAPVLGQFDGGADQVPLVFLQLLLEALEQGEGIGGGAGETGQYLTVIQAPDLLGVAFHHGVAQGNLAVAAHDDFAVAADRYDGGQGGNLHTAGPNARNAGRYRGDPRLFNRTHRRASERTAWPAFSGPCVAVTAGC